MATRIKNKDDAPGARVVPTPGYEVLNKVLTYRLARLHAKLNTHATRLLNEHADISLTQWRILSLVGRAASTTLAQIGKISDADMGQLSRRLKDLVRDGIIVSVADSTDKRRQHLSLSPRGQKIYEALLPIMAGRHEALAADLTVKERESLFQILDKLEATAERLLGGEPNA